MSRLKLFKNGLAFGHIIECFDNTLYGFFSVLLAPIFFSSADPLTQTLSTFGAFAAGFITKPLGAIVFGIFGDATNRSTPLVLSIGLVGLPTLMIGLLPSYQDIGILAPIVLIICRMLQGFFFGGEFAGVNVYIFETCPKEDLGRNTGLLIASGVIGAILATVTGLVAVLQVLPSWGWRIPFIMGGFLAFFSFYIRKNLEKVPVDSSGESYMQSVRTLLKDYKKEMIFCFVLSGLTTIPLNLSTVYANKIFNDLGFTPSESMALNGLTMIFNALFLIPCGKISDMIGFKAMIKRGCLANIVVAVPAFSLLTGSSVGFSQVALFIFLMMASGTLINGCAFPYMASFFPTKSRYTGLAVCYTLGTALLSGTSPLIATLLTSSYGSEIAVSWYIIFVSALTLILHHFFILKRSPTKPMSSGLLKEQGI
jgi:MHS family proline/betaine transporter-like MFS transporter